MQKKVECFGLGNYILGALEFGAAIAAGVVAVNLIKLPTIAEIIVGGIVSLVAIFIIALVDGSLRG